MLRALKSLAVTVAVVIGAGGIGVAASSALTTAVTSPVPWVVTVGTANRTLYPGVTATVPYSIRNASSQRQLLHEVSAHLKNDGADMFDTNTGDYRTGCAAVWFAAKVGLSPASATGTTVNADTAVMGSVDLEFRADAASQAACQNIGLAIDVTAA